MSLHKFDPDYLESAVKLIGKDWMLITVGTEGDYNTMTASWGGLGQIWSAPSAFVFIRPQRYTYTFAEKYQKFTVCFFDEKYRKALSFIGLHSGRDCDKAKETGMTPVYCDGYTYFAEAKTVLVCDKLYAQDLREECFIKPETAAEFYPTKDFHRMYVGKITDCMKI